MKLTRRQLRQLISEIYRAPDPLSRQNLEVELGSHMVILERNPKESYDGKSYLELFPGSEEVFVIRVYLYNPRRGGYRQVGEFPEHGVFRTREEGIAYYESREFKDIFRNLLFDGIYP